MEWYAPVRRMDSTSPRTCTGGISWLLESGSWLLEARWLGRCSLLLRRSYSGQASRVVLKGTYAHLTCSQGLDPLHRGGEPLNGSYAGHAFGNCRRPDLVPVDARTNTERRVDDQVDVAGQDAFDGVRRAITGLVVLAYNLCQHPIATEDLGRALGGEDLETQVREPLDREDHRALVTVRNRDEHVAAHGKPARIRGHLGLGE